MLNYATVFFILQVNRYIFYNMGTWESWSIISINFYPAIFARSTLHDVYWKSWTEKDCCRVTMTCEKQAKF